MNKERLWSIAQLRSAAMQEKKRRRNEEKEKTAAAMKEIGEAYWVLTKGCEGDDTEISFSMSATDNEPVTVTLFGAPVRCCYISLKKAGSSLTDLILVIEMCKYSCRGGIHIVCLDSVIERLHRDEDLYGSLCGTAWAIFDNPDSFIEKMLDAVEGECRKVE